MELGPVQILTRRPDWSKSAVLGPRSSTARDFADLVAAKLVGTVLPFSHRESLLQAAAERGISRFEANLIIATVQHNFGIGRKRITENYRPFRFPITLAAFLIVQGAIVAAVWYLLF
jgi:hypothetical protein